MTVSSTVESKVLIRHAEPMARGTLPYRVWIGVTGHRRLPASPELPKHVRQALDQIKKLLPTPRFTEVLFGVVSPLADGADRMVASEVLTIPGAILEAALPMPRDEYENDFDDRSRGEFRELLARAAEVTVQPRSSSREEAYERVGIYVVSRADFLIALWDGQRSRGRGGTADVVDEANTQGVPAYRISTFGDFALGSEAERFTLPETVAVSLAHVDRYNKLASHHPPSKRTLDDFVAHWTSAAEKAQLSLDIVRPLAAWLAPYLATADSNAIRYRRHYALSGSGVFLAAAAAVLLAAIEGLFRVHEWVVAIAGLVLISCIGVVVFLEGHWHLSTWWVSSRVLAERLRVSLFQALFPSYETTTAAAAEYEVADYRWVTQSFNEIWRARPKFGSGIVPFGPMRDFLVLGWIDDQIQYYRSKYIYHRKRNRQLGAMVALLFVLTLLATGLHAFIVITEKTAHTGKAAEILSWPTVAIGIAIVLPALVAAVRGIEAQAEHRRIADRFERMAAALQSVRGRIARATSLADLASTVQEAARLMLDEHRDWFGLMRFQELELHA